MSSAAESLLRDPGRIYPPPPLTRRELWWRYGVVLGLVALLLLIMVFNGSFHATRLLDRVMAWIELPLSALVVLLARYRRRWSWLPLAIAPFLGLGTTLLVPFAWILVSVATRRRWWEVAPAILVGALSVGGVESALWASRHAGQWPGPRYLVGITGTCVLIAMVLAVIASAGYYEGARRDLVAALQDRAMTAERESAAQAESARAAERARIAREMHDVLAHRISLVSMHAGVLAYRDDLSVEQTREIAGIIQANAHDSLTELRSVLGSLRGDGEAPPLPQPTLADLPGLIEEQRGLGVVVELSDQLKQREELSPLVARQLFRIVQEALTNARKHAAGAPVWVTLYGRPGEGVHVDVRNPLTQSSGVPGAGLGLLGLRERVAVVGGTLSAEVDRGDFVVRAWIPWQS